MASLPQITGRGMGGLSISISQLDEALNLVDELTPAVIRAALFATRNEAQHLFDVTQDLVPIGPTGNLRASGRVTPVEVVNDELTAGIAYGGPAGSGHTVPITVRIGGSGSSGKGGKYGIVNFSQQAGDVDYAVIVHEDLQAHHPMGQAKYVEGPVRGGMTSGKSLQRMQRDMEKALHLKRGSLR